MITKAQHEFTKNKLGQIIPVCAACGGFIRRPFCWKAMAMVFLHNSKVLSWLYHHFPFLRSWVGCQDLVINLSLKNLSQAIRLGWDLCPWGKSPVWFYPSVGRSYFLLFSFSSSISFLALTPQANKTADICCRSSCPMQPRHGNILSEWISSSECSSPF